MLSRPRTPHRPSTPDRDQPRREQLRHKQSHRRSCSSRACSAPAHPSQSVNAAAVRLAAEQQQRAALRAELSKLEPRALKQRARQGMIPEEKIEGADKGSLIELILASQISPAPRNPAAEDTGERRHRHRFAPTGPQTPCGAVHCVACRRGAAASAGGQSRSYEAGRTPASECLLVILAI
jgi:hypothetical protein